MLRRVLAGFAVAMAIGALAVGCHQDGDPYVEPSPTVGERSVSTTPDGSTVPGSDDASDGTASGGTTSDGTDDTDGAGGEGTTLPRPTITAIVTATSTIYVPPPTLAANLCSQAVAQPFLECLLAHAGGQSQFGDEVRSHDVNALLAGLGVPGGAAQARVMGCQADSSPGQWICVVSNDGSRTSMQRLYVVMVQNASVPGALRSTGGPLSVLTVKACLKGQWDPVCRAMVPTAR